MIPLLQQNIISNNKYLVRFAQDAEDLKAAQRLRYNVFNVELGEGLSTSTQQQLDVDPYDKQCHHLLVIHLESEEIIGTYRMQTYEIAQKRAGFYTAEEFNLEAIPDEILNNSVEVGRACISADHRNGRVLFLLWRGIAKYLNYMQSRYLLGCCSLTSQSASEGWKVMRYLEDNSYLHESLQVAVTEKYRCEKVEFVASSTKAKVLPQLFRLYMDLGAKVCSPPAMDRDFKTIDFLVLLDIHNLDERTRMLFFN